MFRILDVNKDVNDIYTMKIMAPRIAKSIRPGQFIILKMDEKGERIPFPICDYSYEEESITIVFRKNEEISINQLSNLKAGDSIQDLVGPIGQASFFITEDINDTKAKNILFVTDEVSAARIYPALSYLQTDGISSDVIINFSKEVKNIAFKEKIEAIAGDLKNSVGNISDTLENIFQQSSKYDLVITIAETEFMEKVCSVTKKHNVKTIVSLTTLMLDGIGMCGGCRLTVDGTMKFACQDGPEFNGHLIDFEEVKRREKFYSSYEAKLKYRQEHGGCDHSENEVIIGTEVKKHE